MVDEISDRLLAAAGTRRAGGVGTRAGGTRAGRIGTRASRTRAGRISTRAGSTGIFLYRGRVTTFSFAGSGAATTSGESESTHNNHTGK